MRVSYWLSLPIKVGSPIIKGEGGVPSLVFSDHVSLSRPGDDIPAGQLVHL